MTRVPPVFASGIRQNMTITAAAGSYALSALPDVVTDDMVILVGVFISNNYTVTNLNGWTQLYLQNAGTRCWGVWYRRRLIGDGGAHTTPTLTAAVGGNAEFQQSAWRGVDWAQPIVSGATYTRPGSQTTTIPPAITVPAGSISLAVSIEASNAIENDGSETYTAGWIKAIGYGDQTTASVAIEHALIITKTMAAGGTTDAPTITWVNAVANGAGVQIGLTGKDVVSTSVSPLDATGVKYWDPATSTWISASRGPKGPVGPAGPAGAASSERPVSLANRNLGEGQSLGQGWNLLSFSATPGAGEVNSPVANQDNTAGSLHRWRFLKTGAYLVTATMWLAGGAPAIPNMCLLGLFRKPQVGSEIEWARNQFGPGGGAQTLTALVLARADDMWHMGFYRTTTGTQTHGPTSIYITPVGPCRVGGDYDHAVLSSQVSYNSGAATVSSYTLVPPAAGGVIVPGDWMYLVHLHPYSTTNPTVTPPQGWEVVVPLQPRNTAPNGLSWGIWRKKYAAGDECQVNLSAAAQVRASMLIVRQQTDAKPTVSNVVAPRGAVNPAKVTVPSAEANGVAVYIAMMWTPGTAVAPPPTASAPATSTWFTCGNPATESLWLTYAWQNPPTTVGAVDFTWPTVSTDTGMVAGVTLTWPRVAFP